MNTNRPSERALGIWLATLFACATAAVGCTEPASKSVTRAQSDAAVTTPHDAGRDAAAAQEVPEGFLADATSQGWKTLLTGRWTLDPGKEAYRCVRFTLPHDVVPSAFRELSPFGTHHVLLTIADDTDVPDGTTECDGNTRGLRSVAATGANSDDFDLPQGVAVQLHAGEQLLLNLHLINLSDRAIDGQSGTLVKLLDPQDIQQTAENILAGTVDLTLPPGEKTLQRGQCTLQHDATIFAVSPYMHRLGVHLMAVAKSSLDGTLVVLHDADYTVFSQYTYALDQPVQLKTGDQVQVECMYNNTTARTVSYGTDSTDELCFADLAWYPSGSGSFICTQ